MYYSKESARGKFLRSIGEMYPYTIKKRKRIDSWSFNSRRVSPEFKWSPDSFPVYFSREIELPPIDADEQLILRNWFGGESLVRINGITYGEINTHHRELDLSVFAGEVVLYEADVVPKGLFGSSIKEPVFSESDLLIVDSDIKRIIGKLRNLIELFTYTDDEVLASSLYRILSDNLAGIRIPRDSSGYWKAVLDDPEISGEVSAVWLPEEFTRSEGQRLSEEDHNTFTEAERTVEEELANLKRRFPSRLTMTLSGHAHIDYAWLWPLEETRRKILRTFSNSVRLAKKYPEYIFSQSSAAMYRDVMERDPGLFKEIQLLVKEGRWELLGGMWVESDTNLLNGESLVRQFLYGQRFFMEHFGRKCSTVWLPDVFGFSWILPQIIRKAGMDSFFTTKMTWNEKNSLPHDLFVWRGIDGSEVIYHSFKNPSNGYNGLLEPKDILTTAKNFKDQDLFPETVFSFGYGDGGGGPTDEMIENYRFLKDLPGMPELVMRSFESYFKRAEEVSRSFHVHDGELYLELHRGTYTSQGRIKMAHKECEDLLRLAEMLGAISGYKPGEIELLWRILLQNEFHDILPGSSIKEVYEHALNELDEVHSATSSMVQASFDRLTDEDNMKLTVFNPSSFCRKLEFTAQGSKEPFCPTGEFSCQLLDNGDTLFLSELEIPPTGFVTIEFSNKEIVNPHTEYHDSKLMENEYLTVEVDPEGISVYDKEHLRDVFDGKASIAIFKDIPSYWDAWDIERDYRNTAESLKPSVIKKTEFGPIRETIRCVFQAGKTRIIQDISLYRNSRRVEVKNTVDWHMRRTMLRALFPLKVLTRQARYDLSCGFITRPTTENDVIEQAAFEVPGHRWVDLSEYDYGISILNDGKYGYGVRGCNVSLNLLRSPVFPDFTADEGRHEFTYAVFPHESCDLLKTVQEAELLNTRLLTSKGSFRANSPIFEVKASTLRIMAFKIAENGKGRILRVCELLGSRGTAVIRSTLDFERAYLTNLLEERIEELDVSHSTFSLNYEPFGIYTILLE